MLKELFSYVVGLSDANEHNIDGYIYSDKKLQLVNEPAAEELKTSTLTSIVDYIKGNIDIVEGPFIVKINSNVSVEIISPLLKNSRGRECFLAASPMIPNMEFGRFFSAEEFNIMLQSKFFLTEDKNILLQVIGNLKDEAVKQISDDGVSQAVVVKTGVASVGNVKVPNPVILKPYRTFLEIEQPESQFVFRMKGGGLCGLFEADGGAWKVDAILSIKEYLQDKLAVEIDNGIAHIIA